MTLGALFDLDGVLIDSERLYTKFCAEVGVRYSIPSPTFALDIKGTTLKDIYSKYFPDKQVQNTLTREIVDFEANVVYPVNEGVKRFLSELKYAGFKTAIVTSSNDKKMSRLFDQQPWMQDEFDVIITDSFVKHSKPNPEGYLLAASKIGVQPEHCYVFEDSLQGLLAGHNAGAGAVIGLATTLPREALEGKADVIFDSFKDISLNILPKI